MGIPIGLTIGSFRLARNLIEPWTEFFRFIPAVAMITIAVIWFGIGEESKIFLIIYTTIFIVILNTAAGVASIAPNKLRAAQSLGANKWQLFSPRGAPGDRAVHPHRDAARDGELLHHHRRRRVRLRRKTASASCCGTGGCSC